MSQTNQLKRSHKTDFTSNTGILRERSFIKPNKDPQKRRSQTFSPLKGNKPTMEIYRPPNVRTDLIQNQIPGGRLNVHAKEFTMNHELQNSKSSHNLTHNYESVPLQHSKSSGNMLRHHIYHNNSGLISIVPAPMVLPLVHSTSTHAVLNHLHPRVNFQMSNDIMAQQLCQINNPPPNFGGYNNHYSQNTYSNNLKRSKSLGAADSKELAEKLKSLSMEEADLGTFPQEDQASLKLAMEDPNQLPSRVLMDLVKVVLERVVDGIRYSEAGAKVCIAIIEKEKTQTFVESLVNTCQQWYQERDRILRGIKAGDGTRFTAFMWFLTEMCGQLKRHKHQCQYENIQPDLVLLSILAKCCQACVSLPIKCLPETECLFFVLTSIGRDLENELPSQLEQLLGSVRDGFLDTSGSVATRRTLLQLIELHASDWQLPGSSVLYYYPRIK